MFPLAAGNQLNWNELTWIVVSPCRLDDVESWKILVQESIWLHEGFICSENLEEYRDNPSESIKNPQESK